MTYARWHITWHNLPLQDTGVPAGFIQQVEDTFVSQDGRITTLETASPSTGAVTSVAGRTGTVTLTKADVGLTSVDNTSDINKPVSTAQSTALSSKADLVSTKVPTSELASGTASSSTFLRGDQTWAIPPSGGGGAVTSVAGRTGAVVLTSADVNLGNVDNTSDVNKPVSTAQATADGLAIPKSLFTTKGDLASKSSSAVIRIGVSGTDGNILTEDSTLTAGFNWKPPLWIPKSVVVNVGDLIIGSGTGVVSKLGVSFTDGDLLTADSTNATQGMNWKTPPSVYGTIQDEGTILTQQRTLNFKGTYVTAVNDGASNRTNVTILDPPAETVITPADHNMIAWAYPPELATGSLIVPVGTLILIKLKINVSTTITSIWWGIVTAGVSPVAAQNEVAIYSSAGTKLTSTNVDSSITSTGIKQTTFTGITPAAGFIWVSFLFNASTNPVLARGTSLGIAAQLINAGLTAANYAYAIGPTAQTSSPSSITPASNTQGTAYWAAVA